MLCVHHIYYFQLHLAYQLIHERENINKLVMNIGKEVLILFGAIIGDIVGSRFEVYAHKSKQFELLTDECHATDDSMMTIAIAKALMDAEKTMQEGSNDSERYYYQVLRETAIQAMQEIGRKYPDRGYGGMFAKWIFSDEPQPYQSFGNGSAMRISPVAYVAQTEEELRKLSKIVTEVTHNHPEGLKGAEATALAIFMARTGSTKVEISNKISEEYYSLDFTLDEIRDSYTFDATCQGSVPQAIVAFLESTSFEDAIRNAISLGGDSDTLAAITGSIAEAYYGIPKQIQDKAFSYLDDELIAICREWITFSNYEKKIGKFHLLTKYIVKFEEMVSFGRWITDEGESQDKPVQIPFVVYDDLVTMFIEEFYHFAELHPEYKLKNYHSIIESYGLDWEKESLEKVPLETLDEQCVLALLMGAIRADRFAEGALLDFFNEGFIVKWLRILQEMDSNRK